MGISPLLTMASILVGSGLFGFVGLVISVPVCALLYAIVNAHIEGKLAAKGMPSDTVSYDALPENAAEPETPKETLTSRLRRAFRQKKKNH